MSKAYRVLQRIVGNDSRTLFAIHAGCMLVCGSLALGSYWLVKQPNELSPTELDLPLPIEEAERLVANAKMWSEELAQVQALNAKLRNDAVAVIAWVPLQFDWQRTMKDVQSLAESRDLILVEIRPGDEFDGSRVAIHTATCQLEGTYESVCQFLDGLAKLEYPIWASELSLDIDADSGLLTVVAHLRVPAAGKRTASAFLIEKLVRDSDQGDELQPISTLDLAALKRRQPHG